MRLLNLIKAAKSLRHVQNLSRPEMLALQENRWRALARHALNTSPFYRRHLAGIDPERCSLQDIPPLTKSMLVKNWDEIVSDPRLRQSELTTFLDNPNNWGTLLHGRWVVSKTSGTSGQAISFSLDVESVDWMHAAHSIRNGASASQSRPPKQPPFKPKLRVVAFVRGGAPSTSSALFSTRPWVGSLFARHFCINAAAPWAEILIRLQELRPGYGATESPSIARQWPGVDHLILLEDLTVFENVDANDYAVPEGETGDHVLITPLINRAVPLLRYRLDDRVRVGPLQPGWPFRRIDSLLGRTGLTYMFQVPEERVIVGLDFLKGLDSDPRVKDTQLRQTGPRSIECLYCVGDDVDVIALASEITTNMRAFLDQRACQNVECTARLVPFLEPDPKTGKVERWLPQRYAPS